ncbi:heat shock 70 kDa protein 12A-like [Mercenaria mercenaria]|uniref:heat shock 70 kDa protein 12A-like n=1 Tax=Mercenaria mercenaria TaxID=6596 RepID=UPI00234E8E15|nr:heat shock 70 kDa protein 12A-like [Mercenaria mercenaria]
MGGNVSKEDIRGDTKEEEKPLVVVAIDFGTTYTGYAFSLVRSPTQIYTGKYKNKLVEDREPTTVLLKPDGSFDSFGYRAIRNYGHLSKQEQQNYRFFKTFKMELHNTTDLSHDTMIKDVRKREFSAAKVFSYVIEYLKSLAVSVMREDTTDLKENDIQWMISIPAIWSDSCRQFMREAATSAGIPEEKLRLVLEPEAASMYCRERLMVATGAASIDELPIGYKYILADLGGGTADICAHEIIERAKLRELYKASGGDFGGNKVDLEFYKFMINLVGGPVWTIFQDDYMPLSFEFMKEFEAKKKTFTSDVQTVSLKLENALLEILKTETDETLEETLSQMTSRYKGKLSYKRVDQRLEIKGDIMADFFKHSIDGVISKIKEILGECGEVQTLLLVGGFAESQYLRERIQAKIKNVRILLEQDARLAVMKGAVLMGYKPRNIIERRAWYTYGFSKVRLFQRGTDPEDLKVKKEDGKEYCDGLFDIQIKKGQIVKYDEMFPSSTIELLKDQASRKNTITIELWKSNRKTPRYCTEEEECSRIAEIVMKPPPKGWPERIRIERQLVMGETELQIQIKNATTGEKYETRLDFLEVNKTL